MSRVGFGGNTALCLTELFCDRTAAVSGKIARTSCAAKTAAACPECAVAVGTGETAIQRKPVDLLSKGLFEIIVQTVVGLAQPVRVLCVRGYVRFHISIFRKIGYPA